MKLVSDSVELINKGAWSPEEDQKLISCVKITGSNNWSQVPKAAGLARSGKSCRFRWMNYLRPELKRGRLTMDEKESIMKLHKSLGNKWSQIAAQLPGRTDNEIKNFWHLYQKKPSSKPVHAKNKPSKIKETKRENKKSIGENTRLSYATHDLNSENSSSSSMITETIDFPIAESYSPSNEDEKMVISSPFDESHGEIRKGNLFQDYLWSTEDRYILEIMMDTNILEQQDFGNVCKIDGLTSFWFDTFMEAGGL